MLKKNKELFDYLNITAWHSSGYTGKRGLTATQECWDIAKYNPCGKTMAGDMSLTTGSAHPINTAKCFFEVAPDRKLLQLPFRVNVPEMDVVREFQKTVVETIQKMHVDVMFGAVISPFNGALLDRSLHSVQDEFTYVMNASADDGTGENRMLRSKYIYGIGCYHLDNGIGSPIPVTSHSLASNAITCGPMGIYIPYTHMPYDSTANCRRFYGASCTAAIVAGMLSLVNDYFIHKTGKPLSSKFAKKFIEIYSVYIAPGYSAFKLPNPNEIDITEFTEKGHVEITDITDAHELNSDTVDAVLAALNSGLMTLDENGRFNPHEHVSNADMARFIAKFLK